MRRVGQQEPVAGTLNTGNRARAANDANDAIAGRANANFGDAPRGERGERTWGRANSNVDWGAGPVARLLPSSDALRFGSRPRH
jgi:hypothetical protein